MVFTYSGTNQASGAYYTVSTQRQFHQDSAEAQRTAVGRFAVAEDITIAEFTKVDTGKGADALE